MSNNVYGSFSVVYINEEYRSVGMGSNTVSVSPCGVGAISSGLGLGAGYILAPRKFTLERLLMQNDDAFNRIFSQKVMQNATKAEIKAVDSLKNAAKEYRLSGKSITDEKIKPEANLWNQMVKKVNVDDRFVKQVAETKTVYQQALKDARYAELKNSLDSAAKNVAANPKDTNLYLVMKASAREFADAQLAVEKPLKDYKNARNSFRAARDEAILNLPDKGKAISEQWAKVMRAISERANVMYEKLATLSAKDSLKNDYSAVKKYIPKSRTYSSLMGGIIAGIGGVIAGVYSLNKIKSA